MPSNVGFSFVYYFNCGNAVGSNTEYTLPIQDWFYTCLASEFL